MIIEGLGIGFGPAFMGSAEWRDGTIVEVLNEWRAEEAPLYVVRLDKRHTPQRIEIVQRFVVDTVTNWIDSYRPI